MKVLSILPPFLPIEEISSALGQVMPEGEIVTSTDFGSNEAEVLIVTTFTTVDENLVSRIPNLKFVQVASTGYDNVDIPALRKRNVMLSNIPTANKDSVAEHVIAMALSQLKNIMHFHSEIKSGNWPVLTNSMELMNRTFGIVGMGAIGKKLAEKLLHLGANTVYYDTVRLEEEMEEDLGLTFLELDPLFSRSDIISLHVPLTEQTRGMIGKNEFSKMKDGALIINTSRGGVVDEGALIDAVKSRGIKACIDVYEKEPPDFKSELFGLDNVIFSPHIAGVTVESQQRFMKDTISNVMKFIQGLDPQFRVI